MFSPFLEKLSTHHLLVWDMSMPLHGAITMLAASHAHTQKFRALASSWGLSYLKGPYCTQPPVLPIPGLPGLWGPLSVSAY